MDKYVIYYRYENQSLLDSTKYILSLLDIHASGNDQFESYGDYFSSIVKEKLFLLTQAYNIALASSKECDLLVLDEDAYYNLLDAKNIIDSNPILFDSINRELSNIGISYKRDTNIVYILDLLTLDENLNKIRQKQKVTFKDFSASLFCSNNLESNLSTLFDLFKLKIIFKDNKKFFNHEIFNKNFAYKYSALGFEGALDSGSDFIVTTSMGVFDMFDKKRSKLTQAINRNLGNMPVLFISQLVLLSLGIKDNNLLAFKHHKFIPEFI